MAWRSKTVQQSRWADREEVSLKSSEVASGGAAAQSRSCATTRPGAGPISKNGLRRARPQVGKQVNELDLLLSPSRGLAAASATAVEPLSLSDPEVQDRFREHIQDKVRKWAAPERTRPATQRKEELGTILLDFRKLREGVTSSRRVDPFACEVYEASVLLSLYNANEPQLSSSLPHLVSSLHPAASPPRPTVPLTEPPDLSAPFANLSLDEAARDHPARGPDPARRAYFLVLHLLHSSLLPSQAASAQTDTSTSSSSSAGPTASSFLPTLASTLAALRLEPFSANSASSESSHPDSHIAFLLGLRLALEQNNYAALANDYLSLDKLPPTPASIRSHLEALHLSFPSQSPPSSTTSGSSSDSISPRTFDPLAHLLKSFLPRLRQNRIWPAIQRAYRFPPDQTGWLGKVLLFEFEVEMEQREAGLEGADGLQDSRQSMSRRGEAHVKEDWDAVDDEEGPEDRHVQRRRAIEEEAARRAAAWVAERTSK